MQHLRNIPFYDIKLTDGFWKAREKQNRDVSIPSVLARFEETGRMDALRFVWAKKQHPIHIFYDSDVAKWIEAVAYQIEQNPRGMKKYERIVDKLVSSMKKNQREDGYLNSYFQQKDPEHIYQNRDWHELYCSGHLIEAAIAYDRATGKHDFLEVMKRNVDCIERAFITEKTAAFSTPGHEELELALMKLYRYTGVIKYRDMARHFLLSRGRCDDDGRNIATQSDVDLLHMTHVTGHAVRALYYFTGTADLAEADGDEELALVCKQLFANIQTQTYVTGGFGASAHAECFTVPYDLPNREAYSESCAAIAMLYFLLRLQQMEPDGRYGDMAERVMYNNLLSSTSLGGDAFFYENPLEIDRRYARRNPSMPNAVHSAIFQRVKVFDCSCCPPNINRIFGSLADLFLTESDDTLYVNQYVALQTAACGKLSVTTRYPLRGNIRVSLSDFPKKKIAFRIPAYTEGKFALLVDGKPTAADVQNGYAVIGAAPKMEISLTLPIRPAFVECDPRVRANCGRVALTLGPVVYCLEEKDNGENLHALSVKPASAVRRVPSSLSVFPELEVAGVREAAFPAGNGATVSEGQTPAAPPVSAPPASLYRRAEGKTAPVTLRFIPYFAFANRGESDMQVWVRRK